MEDLFLELILVALGNRDVLSVAPSESEWNRLYETCEKQAVIGLAFLALDKLSKNGQKPPFDVLCEWIAQAEDIRGQNKVVNQTAFELSERLRNDGFECCVLKGQGNAMIYPDPLLRTPGDIDVWIKGHTDNTENIDSVIRYVKGRNPEGHAMYHHIDYGIVNGVEVEVHYRPSFMFNPVHNRRLQKWFKGHTDSTEFIELPEAVGRIRIPNRKFNIIFQLSHVYNHLLHEGIGLRQIIDYYYLLKSQTDNQSPEEIKERAETLKSFGLYKFAGAMMWGLHEMFGLEEKYLIAPMDERRGKVLLAEIMRGGNFGSYDVENQRANSRLKKNIQRFRRDLRMVRYFPSECLWEPVFRTYHFLWRMKYTRMT